MTEIFKIKNESAPPVMDSMFERRNNLIFKNFLSVLFSYLSPQLCSPLPENTNEVEFLKIFKRKVINWICGDCLCKSYLQNIGFL